MAVLSSGEGQMRMYGNYPLTSYTNNTERMRISSDCDVGIGTTSPAVKLVVSNGGALGYEIDPENASGEVVSIFSYNRSTAAWKTTRYSALDHRFEVNGTTEAMRIQSDGNVTIGNTASVQPLTVAGNVLFRT